MATDITKVTATVNGVNVVITAMMDNTSVIDYSPEFEVTDEQIVVQCSVGQPTKRAGFTYIEFEKMG